jgi:thymidine phosphorylase
MLTLGGLAQSQEEAEAAIRRALDSGRAAEIFQKMVSALGGPADFVEHPTRHLPHATVIEAVPPEGAGTVAAIDTRALGLAVVALGGGRTRADDAIDHSVGLTELAGIGDYVGPDRPLCLVHARDANDAEAAAARICSAYTFGEPPRDRRLIYERIGGEAK